MLRLSLPTINQQLAALYADASPGVVNLGLFLVITVVVATVVQLMCKRLIRAVRQQQFECVSGWGNRVVPLYSTSSASKAACASKSIKTGRHNSERVPKLRE